MVEEFSARDAGEVVLLQRDGSCAPYERMVVASATPVERRTFERAPHALDAFELAEDGRTARARRGRGEAGASVAGAASVCAVFLRCACVAMGPEESPAETRETEKRVWVDGASSTSSCCIQRSAGAP